MNHSRKKMICLFILSILILSLFTGCRQSPLLRQKIYSAQETEEIKKEEPPVPKENDQKNTVAKDRNLESTSRHQNTKTDITQGNLGDPGIDVGTEVSDDGTLGQVVSDGGIKIEVPKSVANVTTVGEDTQSPHWKSSRTSSSNETVGEWVSNIVDGKGTYKWSDGDQYTGEWKYDMFAGQGTYSWADGDNYSGTWQDDMFEGEGSYTWASGSNYVGEWKAGAKQGKGTYTWANGDKYIGQWKDGVKDGQGTYTWADGSVYTGEWKYGIREGKGTYQGADGIVYDGSWLKDKFVSQ